MLSEDQYGFRTGKSTSGANIDHLDFVNNDYDTGRIVASFFLDFKKAFYYIDHSIFLAKLVSIGIHGVAKLWFQSYLTIRQQLVSLDHVKSDKSLITHRLPQGSLWALCIILFLMMIFPQAQNSLNLRHLLMTARYLVDSLIQM